MSLRRNIEHLATAPGIVATSVISPTGPRELRGDERWGPILDAAVSLLEKTGEKTIRLVVGNHTIIMELVGDETVGVVLPTGHAIAKSLRRMIRRLSRKVRGPAPTVRLPPAQQPTTTDPNWPESHRT